ncbi:ATP synthase F1 subunit delta [candidate division KSB1 bacterium]|nr:ATP synthase F1 subunit delta [candidate division KSB1 bacterium]
MKINKVTQRYANAVYDLASEHERFPELLNDFKRFIPLFFKNDTEPVELHFSSPSARATFLNALEEAGFSALFINVIRLLILNHRFSIILALYKQLQNKLETLSNITHIVIETAIELDDDAIETVKLRIEKHLNKRVRIVNRVDPKILGGMVLYLNGTAFNTSISSRSKMLRQFLIQTKR